MYLNSLAGYMIGEHGPLGHGFVLQGIPGLLVLNQAWSGRRPPWQRHFCLQGIRVWDVWDSSVQIRCCEARGVDATGLCSMIVTIRLSFAALLHLITRLRGLSVVSWLPESLEALCYSNFQHRLQELAEGNHPGQQHARLCLTMHASITIFAAAAPGRLLLFGFRV